MIHFQECWKLTRNCIGPLTTCIFHPHCLRWNTKIAAYFACLTLFFQMWYVLISCHFTAILIFLVLRFYPRPSSIQLPTGYSKSIKIKTVSYLHTVCLKTRHFHINAFTPSTRQGDGDGAAWADDTIFANGHFRQNKWLCQRTISYSVQRYFCVISLWRWENPQ